MTPDDINRLHSFGFHLVQLRPGEKSPAGGTGWQARLIAPGHPFDVPAEANVGVMGGCPVRSGYNLVVIDVDVKNGKRGRDSLARVQAEHGRLPHTARATTPSGGEHYYLAAPGDIPLCGIVNLFTQLGYPGIDLIGAGLFVVAPPSVFANGGSYDWLYRPDEDGVGVAVAPPWLLSWLRLAGRPAAPPPPRKPHGTQRKTVVGPPSRPPSPATRPIHVEPFLADIVRRYPVGSETSRNPQMSKAVAALAARRVSAPVVKELIFKWLEHFAGSYTTAFDQCVIELERCQNSLRRKIESGRFILSAVNHAVDQSNLKLDPAQEDFLAALSLPCPFLTIVEKDKGTEDGGGWDKNEESIGHLKTPRLQRLSPAERQFAECLVRLVAYKIKRGEVEGDEFLTTNEQMMDLLAARFGVVFKSSVNELAVQRRFLEIP